MIPPRERRALLESLLRAALRAADPAAAVRRAVRIGPGGAVALLGDTLPEGARVVALALGKAACAMAGALEGALGDRLARGLAITKDGHALPLRRFAVREAAHPVPDARGEAAAREALALAAGVAPGEVLVVLLSGGTSALTSCPPPGVGLPDLAATNAALLASGAPIAALNAVRKHLSVFSGGRLAAACAGRRVFVLAISDVIGDAFDVIGSGPCAPDPTTFADALRVVDAHALRLRLPPAALAVLEAGAAGRVAETPKPGDAAFARVRSALLASNADALAGACAAARDAGVRSIVVSHALRGEARDAGRRLAALAGAARRREPVVLVAGGETTVTLANEAGGARGGRCQELALAAALALSGRRDVALLAAGTDGSDGPTDAAGAFVDGGTAARGAAAGRDAGRDLARHDSHGFFACEGGLVRTGPTQTNVMDVAFLLLAGAG